MAIIGKVVAVTGTAYIIQANGDKKELQVGDTLAMGDTLQTMPGAMVELAMQDGRTIHVPANQMVALTEDLAIIFAQDGLEHSVDLATIESVLKAIESGQDISQAIEETAAGGGARNAYGFSFVNLLRISSDLFGLPTYAYAATVDQLPELTGYVVDDTRAPAEEPAVIVPNTPAIASISAGNAIEGNPLSYTITLTEAPNQPISYPYTAGGTTSPADLGTPVFSNGVTYNSTTGEITVPPGVTNFTVTYPTIDDTQPENPETLVITIGGVTGTGTITDNEVPQASPDSATTREDTPIAGNVLSNDSQIIGTPLQVTQFAIGTTTYPAGSTATIAGVGP